jgi:hypothetical protein
MKIIVILLGASLLSGAALVATWFWLRRQRSLRLLADALADPREPGLRRAALRMLSQGGLRHFLTLLLWRAQVEQDAAVRRDLARLATQTRWEVPSSPELVELALWAAGDPSEPLAQRRRTGEP